MKMPHNHTVPFANGIGRFRARTLLAFVLFGITQSCTGGSNRSDSIDKFLLAESVAKAAIGTAPMSARGEDEGDKDFILRSWAKRQELPCLFSLTTENSMSEHFSSPLAVRGIVSRSDKFALFYQATNPAPGEESIGNYWVSGLEWWRVDHAAGKEYFAFQYLDSNYGSFMLNALPFGDTNGMSPYKQLINLVEENETGFSETPESFLFIATIPKSENFTVSPGITSVSSWGPARVELFVHKQSLQPTTIQVTSSEGQITCKIDYLETLVQFDDSTLEYTAPGNAIILYDERQ